MTVRQDRTLALALGGLLAIAFTLWAAFNLAGWSVGSVSRDGHRVVRGDIRAVRVDGAFSDLTLVPSSGSQVVVDSHARGSLWLPKIHTRIDGDRVTVTGNCRFVVFGSCSARFVVHVPAGMPVTVTGGSGDVHASGLSGRVTLDVASGDLELHGLTGGATARVSSGDIEADGLGGRVRLRSSSGDVDAAALTSLDVTAHATSGDVSVEVTQPPQRVDASASSGDVTVAVPRGTTYDAQADTSSGDRAVAVASDPSSARRVSAVTSSGDVSIVYR